MSVEGKLIGLSLGNSIVQRLKHIVWYPGKKIDKTGVACDKGCGQIKQ